MKPIANMALLSQPQKRSEPRIPFGLVLERGLLSPGAMVWGGPRRSYLAEVRADGTLLTAEHRGSIHRVGALVQGAPACNGWTFWHFQDHNDYLPLDVLRQKIRAELH